MLLTIGGVAFYKYAPRNDQESLLGNAVAHYMTAREAWTKAANVHLVQSASVQEDVLLQADAKRPPIHRLRFPQ